MTAPQKVTIVSQAVSPGRPREGLSVMQRRIPRLLVGALLACLPVAGLLAGFSPAATAATATAAPASAAPASARAAALAEIRHLLVGRHPTDHRVGHAVRVNGLNQVQSTNWAGY